MTPISTFDIQLLSPKHQSYYTIGVHDCLNYSILLHYILCNSSSPTQSQELIIFANHQYSRLIEHFTQSYTDNTNNNDILLALLLAQCCNMQYRSALITLNTALSHSNNSNTLLLQLIAIDLYCKLYRYKDAIKYSDTVLQYVNTEQNFFRVRSIKLTAARKFGVDAESTTASTISHTTSTDTTQTTNDRSDEYVMDAAGLTYGQIYTVAYMLHAQSYILLNTQTYNHDDRINNYQCALNSLQHLYVNHATNQYIILQLAFVYACIQQYSKARLLISHVLQDKTNQSNYQLCNMYALLLTAQQQYIEALTVCNNALTSVTNTEIYDSNAVQLHITKVYIYNKLNRFEDSLESIIQCLSMIFTSDQIKIQRKTSANNINVLTYVTLDITEKEKETQFHRVINYKLQLLLLLISTYIQYHQQNKHDDLMPIAIKHMQKAQFLVNNNDDQSDVLYHSAIIAGHQYHHQTAATLYTQSIQYNPNNIQSLVGLSELHIHSPQRSFINETVAYHNLQHVLHIDAYDIDTHNLLDTLYTFQNSQRLAQKHHNTVKKLRSTQPIRKFSRLTHAFIEA